MVLDENKKKAVMSQIKKRMFRSVLNRDVLINCQGVLGSGYDLTGRDEGDG